MKKNGFTLVELLAVIVVLAIVITLAVPAVMAISARIRKNMYCTKANLILNAAELYGEDYLYTFKNDATGRDITISLLVQEGYLKKDKCEKDACPSIIDPRDDASMDEYEINLTYNNKRVYAKYTDDSIYKNICE